MITQYEVHALLEEKIPKLILRTHALRSSLEVYTCIIDFTDYTKQILEKHDYNEIKRCFEVAENLYLNGDRMVQLLIKNSFIYSFSSLANKSRSEILIINSILPDALFKVYRKQVLLNANKEIYKK